MKKTIFQYSDYRKFIVDFIESQPKKGRGLKTALSEFIGCQSTYVSRVLASQAEFNFEQAEGITRFFNLTKLEKKFFLLIFQHNRCSTKESKDYLKKEIAELKDQALNIQKRVEVGQHLTESEQEIYYSSWIYSAMHVLSSIKNINSIDDFSRALKISNDKLMEPLNFLIEKNLIFKNAKGQMQMGTTRIHIGQESHLVSHHHRNWRVQALHSIAERNNDNIHYSSVITLSKEDSFEIKSQIIEFIKHTKERIKKSQPEQEGYSFNLDFFKVGSD